MIFRRRKDQTMQYERPAVESRESVEAELLQFLNNNNNKGGKGSMS